MLDGKVDHLPDGSEDLVAQRQAARSGNRIPGRDRLLPRHDHVGRYVDAGDFGQCQGRIKTADLPRRDPLLQADPAKLTIIHYRRQIRWGRACPDDQAAYRQRPAVGRANVGGADSGEHDVAFHRRRRQIFGQCLQQDILQRRRHRPSTTERGEKRRHRIPGRLGEQLGEPEIIECLIKFGAIQVLDESAKRRRHQRPLRGVNRVCLV